MSRPAMIENNSGLTPSVMQDEKQGSHLPDSSPERGVLDSDQGGSDAPMTESSPRQIHGWKWAVAYGSMLSTTFLFALDNTIVADVQPSILESFGQVQLLSWIGTGFALGSTPILPWGKAYGIFNVKWLFISHIILFEVGSVVCGAAPNMTSLIIGRVLTGLGGSGMYSGSLSYISILTSLKEKPLYVAGVAVVWGLGSVLGPVVGGAFATSSATWRWAFYINLVIGAIFAPSYFFLLPDICLQPGKTFRQKLQMVDWIGTTIFLSGAVCFTMAISFGGSTYAWNSGSTISLWVMTGVLLIATFVVTIRHPFVTKENRLLPVHFLNKPELMNLGLQMYLVSGVMLAAVYYIPLFFAFTRGDGPMEAGVRLLPFVCLLVFTSILNGVLMPKTGYYIPWYVAGSMMMLIGSALMVTVNTDTQTANVYGYTILVGAGAGCYLAAGFAVMQAHVPVEDIANAVGFQAIAQVLGSVTFLSVSGSLFYNTAVELVTPVLPAGTPLSFIADLIAGTSSDAFKSLTPDLADVVIPQITKSMRNIWIWYLSASVLSFILSFFLGRKRLAIVAA